MSEFFSYSKKFEDFFKENGSLVKYDKGTHLVWNNDNSEWVFFLVDGFVEASFNLKDETHRIIGYFPPGAVFAQSGSFSNNREGLISYTAKTSAKVYRLKNKKFLSSLKESVDLMSEYIPIMLKSHIFLVERVVYTAEKDLYHKCIRWLLFMKKFYGKKVGKNYEIQIPLTQETIANFLSTTRESINLTLNQIEKENIIELKTKKVIIKDIKKLEKIIK